jgi:hypothetical protein
VVEGKAPARDGLLGFQTRLATIVSHGLYLRDSHSIVMSDFYVEQADNGYLFEGSAEDPPGRATITGAKFHSFPSNDPEKNNVVDIRNYHGQIAIGPCQFYQKPKRMCMRQQGAAPVDLVVWGSSWHGAKPDPHLGPAASLSAVGNEFYGAAPEVERGTERMFSEEAPSAAALARLRYALDRRLGEADLRLNHPEDAVRILFIGNSLTFGAGTGVQTYHPETVTDLNGQHIGGTPSFFKAFTVQNHLNYQVSLETAGGKGLDHRIQEKADIIGRPWDVVCMHGYGTLDQKHPGDPSLLVSSTRQIARLLHDKNPSVVLYLTATWARADQVYPGQGAWHGKSVETMTTDVRGAYDQAAAASPFIKGVIPVGEAWYRALEKGFADPSPYDGIEPGKVDLWGKDHCDASVQGCYLEALVIFGVVTGQAPRSLGNQQQAAKDPGIAPDQAVAMQQMAFEQIAESKKH